VSSYRYFTCDVFTDRVFCGNPLAVLPDARGLSAAQMQSIAREFNYSETTFVLPPDDARHAARVRIFTPGGELPFAGHPTIGTAFVLATIGAIATDAREIVFEEGVGPVPVSIFRSGPRVTHCRLTAARLPEPGPPAPAASELARMLSLADGEVLGGSACWSCGVPFLVVPVASLDALARCALDLPLWRQLLAGYPTQKVYPVARIDALHWRVRMFAPGLGVAEDPATGSAAASFAGWIAGRRRIRATAPSPFGSSRASRWAGRANCTSSSTAATAPSPPCASAAPR
jgi:trans-2,3-dihydro-3-hydroxyanthranilate isomerase